MKTQAILFFIGFIYLTLSAPVKEDGGDQSETARQLIRDMSQYLLNNINEKCEGNSEVAETLRVRLSEVEGKVHSLLQAVGSTTGGVALVRRSVDTIREITVRQSNGPLNRLIQIVVDELLKLVNEAQQVHSSSVQLNDGEMVDVDMDDDSMVNGTNTDMAELEVGLDNNTTAANNTGNSTDTMESLSLLEVGLDSTGNSTESANSTVQLGGDMDSDMGNSTTNAMAGTDMDQETEESSTVSPMKSQLVDQVNMIKSELDGIAEAIGEC